MRENRERQAPVRSSAGRGFRLTPARRARNRRHLRCQSVTTRAFSDKGLF
jgi:hypothetical protein